MVLAAELSVTAATAAAQSRTILELRRGLRGAVVVAGVAAAAFVEGTSEATRRRERIEENIVGFLSVRPVRPARWVSRSTRALKAH
jgi:hypothetical protein